MQFLALLLGLLTGVLLMFVAAKPFVPGVTTKITF